MTACDPDPAGLLLALEQMLEASLGQGPAFLACLSPDPLLFPRLCGRKVEPYDPAAGPYDMVLVLDALENREHPGLLAAEALRAVRPGGYLAICTACGAWPLVKPGKACRLHDLGREELVQIMGAEPVASRYLPRGLVQCGPESFSAGRWLALFAVDSCRPRRDWAGQAWRRARPAPTELVNEVRHAGLF